jgi:hypothetical protein
MPEFALHYLTEAGYWNPRIEAIPQGTAVIMINELFLDSGTSNA